MSVKLLLVGGGKMGGALLTGLLTRGGWKATDVAVVELDSARRDELVAEHEGLVVLPAAEAGLVDEDGGAGLAGKPDTAEAVCRMLGLAGVGRVLSVVAGLAAQRLEACLPDGAVVIRAMPNTPALVGAGVTAIAGGSQATAAHLARAQGILEAVGTVVRVPERQLDAVTGLSGSGPAYVFLVAESLIEAGVLSGLDRVTATRLANQTILGAARMLNESGESAERLRHNVTSPAGTTAAGLKVLEDRGVRSAF